MQACVNYRRSHTHVFRLATCARESFNHCICETLWLRVHSLHLAFPSFTFLARGASHSLNSSFTFEHLHWMHTQKPRGGLVAHLRHFRILSSSFHMRVLYAAGGNNWPHGPAHSFEDTSIDIQPLHLCGGISHIRLVNAACGSSRP